MSRPSSPSRLILILIIIVVLLALLQKTLRPYLRQRSRKKARIEQVQTVKPVQPSPIIADPASRPDAGLDRNPTQLIFTKHARCRMGCRHIEEAEVRTVLRNGVINWQKSDLRANPDPKYAVEGDTPDGQRVRIVFASAARGLVVVTVIDLGEEWVCDCK